MSTFLASAGRAAVKVAPPLYLLLASLLVLALAYQFTAPVTLEVGSGDDTAFIQGFSFREDLPDGASFRWSDHLASIVLWGLGAQDGALKLRLAVPPQNRAAGVTLFANDQLLGELHPEAGFQDYSFPVTRAVIGPGGDLRLTLVSNSTFTAPPDTRNLGAQVSLAEFAPRGGPVLPAPRALYLVALALLAFIVARVWTGSRRAATLAGALALLLAAFGIVAARVETVWFAAPLFWLALALLLGALAFARLLSIWQPALSARTLRWLFAAMALAFAVRMALATGPGFIVDVQDYVVWSYKTATYGLGSAYAALNGLWIADQSPGIVYLLHAGGLIYRAVFSPDFLYPVVAGAPGLRALTTNPAVLADPVQRTLLRMPSLLADLLTGALILAAARSHLSERGAWLAAFAYWFNPAVLWNGAYWGEMDAVHALLVLAAFLLLDSRRTGLKPVAAAFFILGAAALTKPQAAIFGPLLLLWAYREARWRGAACAVLAGAAGAGVMLVPILAAGGGSGLLAYFADTIGHHPIISANAHNLWWLVAGGQINVPDTSEILPGTPLTYRTFSLVLFGLFYLATLAKAWRAGRDEWFAYGAFIAFAFFMLPTEIHENYGYALLPLLAVALTRDGRWIAFYAAVSATMVLNYALSDPPLYAVFGLDRPDAQLALPRLLNAAANTLLLAAWTIYLFARGIGFSPRVKPAQMAAERR